MSGTTISVLYSAAWFPGMPGSGVSYIIKQGMHCEGLNSLTDQRRHNICNLVCRRLRYCENPSCLRNASSHSWIHLCVHMCTFRSWSWTALSRILNVATSEGDWRMKITQMRRITDGEAWYFWNECTTEQDKNTCLFILSSLESFLSRNKCLFILCFQKLCNCFWLWSHHLQRGVARRLRQGALMRGAVPCILSIWVGTKMQIPPFVFIKAEGWEGIR